MKHSVVKKEPGISWIQVKNRLHCFLVGDKKHNEINEIHLALKDFYGCYRAAGYPDTNVVFQDVEEEQKENELLYHSEKLATVYGILRTPTGAPIQIMKNLRIVLTCGVKNSDLSYTKAAQLNDDSFQGSMSELRCDLPGLLIFTMEIIEVFSPLNLWLSKSAKLVDSAVHEWSMLTSESASKQIDFTANSMCYLSRIDCLQLYRTFHNLLSTSQ
ncbi:hypothetical protein GH714_033501 [Hevea brasiliensis]|uniref:DYW domain-containing protein n=1 Tax=Hevea brasiliensis TaxID=3981 RepID=A0A6A6NAB3_HEVBR|nr:hypothetical protein GH714_033501 [Hevea brasiliensis]